MTYVQTYEKPLTECEREAEEQWMHDHDTTWVVDPAPNEYAAPVASCAAAHWKAVMSYMKEVALLIEWAAAHGVTLEVNDFRTIDGQLTIDGMPAGEWVDTVIGGVDPYDETDYHGKDGE
jgi:hypothetical protein